MSEKTVRNAAEDAEAVDGTPTRPLAGSSCWRCSIHKGDKLSPLSESGSSCYGATTTHHSRLTDRLPKTVKIFHRFLGSKQPRGSEKEDNLTSFTAGTEVRAHTLRAIPRKRGKFFLFFAPPQSLYIARYGN